MKNSHKLLAGILTLTMMISTMQTSVHAAENPVATSESMYVNLNYYGKVNQINIVKNCTLNGMDRLEDFGSYKKVTNMTNKTAPILTAEGVKWNLPKNTDNFYYECTPKTKIELPWTFAVSYKLNGVPSDAKKLAGTSGIVEIVIKATPNKNANTYYKNNMLLEVGSYVDMSKNLSVDAPGAQITSIGEKKLVMFTAMPGEKKEFTMRIGSNKFETTGVVMMMTPGTMDQMKKIKDIKDAKDQVEDSMDAINDSTNILLNTMESLSGGLNQTKSGVSTMNDTRENLNASKDDLYQKADISLADLASVASQTATLVPHLETAQSMVKDMNSNINTMSKNISDMKPILGQYKDSVAKIKEDLTGLQNSLEDSKKLSSDGKKLVKDTRASIQSAKTNISDLKESLNLMKDSIRDLSRLSDDLKEETNKLEAISPELANEISIKINRIQEWFDSMEEIVYAMSNICNDSDIYINTATEAVNLADSTIDKLVNATNSAENLLGDTNKTCDIIQDTIKLSNTLIDSTVNSTNTINKYKDSTINALKDTKELTNRFISVLNSSNTFLSSFEATLKANDGTMNQGMLDSMNGLTDVLGKSISSIGETSHIKKDKDTVKNIIEDKKNDLEDDSNILNLDANAKPVSFTSSKNQPKNVEIILRTDEISVKDDNPTKTSDTSDQKANPFKRMLNILVKIKDAVVSIFANR